ncbi:hypothetical protein D3C80_2035500 [compost metagenome]
MDEAGGRCRMLSLRDQPALQVHRVGDGGGKADRLHFWRVLAETREAEREEMAALGGDE